MSGAALYLNGNERRKSIMKKIDLYMTFVGIALAAVLIAEQIFA